MAAARGHFNLTARTLPEPHPHSVWHSPVPYLFAGLAVMLGLVAFALLILACSYWKLSGHFDARNDGDSSQNQQDLEAGAEEEEEGADRRGEKKENAFEEKIVVIVAGRANTMFLATPILSPSSSNCSTSTSTSSNCRTRLSCFEESECGSDGDKREKLAVGEAEIASKHGESDQVDRSRELENQDGSDRRS